MEIKETGQFSTKTYKIKMKHYEVKRIKDGLLDYIISKLDMTYSVTDYKKKRQQFFIEKSDLIKGLEKVFENMEFDEIYDSSKLYNHWREK